MTSSTKGYLVPLCLSATLSLTAGSSAFAQAWPIETWEGWNTQSRPHYPGKTWSRYVRPEEAGWSSEGLADAQKLSKAFGSAAVMVVFDGLVLAEWGDVERRYLCHSIRKSLLSALYGIAVAKGQIDIEDTLGSLGIEDKTPLTEAEKQARIADLLKARSGIYLPAAYESPGMKNSRPKRGSRPPGNQWYYNNWDFNALGEIFNKETGDDLFEAFEEEIARPLQMQDFDLRHTYYHLEAEHSNFPAYPFRMSARDLARFGLLYLNEGRWQDRQIIPSDWVRESTEAHSATGDGGGYGYMWWTAGGRLGELGAYAAAGWGGHWVYVIPKAKLVVVHRADTYEDRHIQVSSMRTILNTILNARIGPPVSNPDSSPMTQEAPVQSPAVSPERLAAMTGNYRLEGFRVRVYEANGGLQLDSLRWGRYALIPEEDGAFLVEDAEKRLEFVQASDGKVTAMRIDLGGEEPYELTRLP